jgi:hypothetical protein
MENVYVSRDTEVDVVIVNVARANMVETVRSPASAEMKVTVILCLEVVNALLAGLDRLVSMPALLGVLATTACRLVTV